MRNRIGMAAWFLLMIASSTLLATEATKPVEKAEPAASKSNATPPGQPAEGPGGAEYRHADVVISEHLDGAKKYHLFQPANPKPKDAPVVVFTHGWGAIHPVAYGKWIEHLVRRGNIVIYPHYQANLLTPSWEYIPNAVASVKDAIAVLEKDGNVKPDVKKVAYVGHSCGGILAANLSAIAKDEGLPAPKAVMVIQPGMSSLFPLRDMAKIPAGTLMLSVAGDQDKITGDADAKKIFSEATSVKREDKDYIVLQTDGHGKPALRGSHMAPVAFGGKGIDTKGAARFQIRAALERGLDGSAKNKGGIGGSDGDASHEEAKDAKGGKAPPKRVGNESNLMTDAMDFYGCWKLLDGLTDAAFFGKNREYALGNTPEQRFMGKWSDGTAVKELIVTKEP